MRVWLLVAAIVASVHAACAADATYRDKRQPSFTLLVPDGWTADASPDGVILQSGRNSFHLNVQLGARRPGEVLVSLRPQFEKQWQNFGEASAGKAKFGGQAGGFAVYSGVPPSGIKSFIRIVTMTDGRLTFTAFESSPAENNDTGRATLARIEQSFSPDPVQ